MPSSEAGRKGPKRVWIDLSNSPHALLFSPVASELGRRGHQVLVTARDNAQTAELARQHWPDVEVIGAESPPGRARKVGTLLNRVAALRRWAKQHDPDVALSHNSYAQVVAARSLGIPCVTAMDFEHQPANHVAFRLASLVLMPEAVAPEAVRRQGARASKLRHYPGYKECIYLGDFEPDPEVAAKLGVERNAESRLVVLRTPPSRAIYHRFANPLFVGVLETISRQPDVRSVVLARHPEQRRELSDRALSHCIVPDRAVDTRSLIYSADLVVGAGGTMTREAALMGIPTVSLFAGQPPAVDLRLEAEGRLRRVTSCEQLGPVESRQGEPVPIAELRESGARVRDHFIEAVVQALDSSKAHGRWSGVLG
jgi:uncharacterized protein